MQLMAIVISSIAITLIFNHLRFSGLPVIIGIFTFCDAWKSGIYRRKDKKSLVNLSPAAWGIVVQAVFLLFFPIYMVNRDSLRTRKYNNVYLILAIIVAALYFLPYFIQAINNMASM